MTTAHLDRFIHHLCRAVLRQDDPALSDGQLLETFITRRDAAAFEMLVRRHGAMVYGVCRRALGNCHDAEDAFQATFLVLLRKADSIRPREKVGNWLHGVARMTALRVRVLAAKRGARERQVEVMPEPEAPAACLWEDLRPVLDRELKGLPEKYRVPIICCDLEGKSIKEAARQLDWPQGTVAGRLARGRTLLARRMLRHGLQVSAACLATLLAEHAVACVPAPTVSGILTAASAMTAGKAIAPGVVSAQVASLTQGVLKTMFLSKIKLLTAITVFGVIAITVGARLCSALAQPPAPSVATPPPVLAVAIPTDTEFSDGRAQLPCGPTPIQALVRLDKDGQLIVRTQLSVCEPVTRLSGGRTITSYKVRETNSTHRYDLKKLYVYDMRGHSFEAKAVPGLFKHKEETLVLFATDQFPIDPLHLRLYREDALLVVAPATHGNSLPPAPATDATTPTPAPRGARYATPVPVQPIQPAPAPSSEIPTLEEGLRTLPSQPPVPTQPPGRGKVEDKTPEDAKEKLPVNAPPSEVPPFDRPQAFPSQPVPVPNPSAPPPATEALPPAVNYEIPILGPVSNALDFGFPIYH